MYDREKTNRSPSYGTESTWRGCPGKCIRLDGECVRFEGQDIVFPKSSVGAAQQAILAAVLAKGVTHLYNCAKEPEVFWLCRYLKTMGALIEGEETGEITIRGVDELKGGDYRIPPDRIVAGTICVRLRQQEVRLFFMMYLWRSCSRLWKYIGK